MEENTEMVVNNTSSNELSILGEIDKSNRRTYSSLNLDSVDNKKLLSNLFDSSGKVIISAQDFCELVALMVSNDNTKVNPSDIVLTLREDFISSCLKIKISPYKKIVSIRINNQDLQDAQREAYNMLTNTYKISTETVYDDEQLLTSETKTTKTKTTK